MLIPMIGMGLFVVFFDDVRPILSLEKTTILI